MMARVPPNNWVSLFGGSAWEWVPAVHQFYYHEFYKQQPDLNWRNPAVEKAMFGAMRFWLDRGVAASGWTRFRSCLRTPTSRREELGERTRRAIRPGRHLLPTTCPRCMT